MNTITSKKSRYDLFASKLSESTLYIHQVFQQLLIHQKQKQERPSTCRELTVAIRKNRYYQFRTMVSQKYKHLNSVFNMACDAYVSLCGLSERQVKVYGPNTYCPDPMFHIFEYYLKKAYINSALLQTDDEFGTQYRIMESEWPDIIRTAIELKLDVEEDVVSEEEVVVAAASPPKQRELGIKRIVVP